jgi:hypothetical protein
MLTGENIAGATHICRKLIDLIESAIHDGATKSLVPQVAHYEIVGGSLRKFMKFQIYPANPKPIVLQTFDKMATNETSGPAYQRTFCHLLASPSPCRDFAAGHRKINRRQLRPLILAKQTRFSPVKYPKTVGSAVSAM